MNRRRHVATQRKPESSPSHHYSAGHDDRRLTKRRKNKTKIVLLCAALTIFIRFVAAKAQHGVWFGLRSDVQKSSERDLILRALVSSVHPADNYNDTPLPLPPSRGHDVVPSLPASSLYIDYRAARGLGHRLTRIAAAYHLAGRLGVGLKQHWGTCPAKDSDGAVDIYNHLFGEDDVSIMKSFTRPLPRRMIVQTDTDNSTNPLIVSNEVPGYKPYATRDLRDSQLARELLEASIDLYRRLRRRFLTLHHGILRNFITNDGIGFFNRNEYVVIGIHVRAGNGKGGEFVEKGRNIADIFAWVQNAAAVVSRYIDDEGITKEGKRVLIYVATDTASVIHLLKNVFGNKVEVMFFPQSRMEGTGPSYQIKNERCLEEWENQMVDMVLLSLSDVIIAARYSSFTQTMPLALLFGDRRGQELRGDVSFPYCELSANGVAMSCFKSFQGWKARLRTSNPHRIVYQSSGRVDNRLGGTTTDGHEDALAYPLATEDCLRNSAEYYFMDRECLRAHLLCDVHY